MESLLLDLINKNEEFENNIIKSRDEHNKLEQKIKVQQIENEQQIKYIKTKLKDSAIKSFIYDLEKDSNEIYHDNNRKKKYT